jgi:limonene-1,2-epoxide hydrolase
MRRNAVTANADLVSAFCRAWSNRNVDELLDYFTDDAVYHNMPMAPLRGKAAIKAILDQIISPTTWIEWEMLNLAESGDVVFTERVDRFEMGGKKVELPVAGVFEIEGGKIRAWRDYFDMAAWTRQTTG